MQDKKYKAVIGGSMCTKYKPRYVIVDTETGEIVDDAQGYGYKDMRGAYAAFGYKNRDKSKDKEKRQKEAIVRRWCKEHKSFVKLVDEISFEIIKGSWGPHEKVDAKLIGDCLRDNGYTDVPFSPGEFLKYWRKNG